MATDEEQLEALQRWWQENGRSIIVALVLAIAGVLGYQQWQSYQSGQAEAASSLYEQFRQAAASGGVEQAAAPVEQLQSDHAGSPYAALASLRLANALVEAGNLDQAEQTLRWVVENAGTDGLQRQGRLSLARVLWARDAYAEAMKALGEPPEGAYVAEYQELRGDILAAQGQPQDAAEAYRKALESPELSSQYRGLIQTKLNDLAVDSSESQS